MNNYMISNKLTKLPRKTLTNSTVTERYKNAEQALFSNHNIDNTCCEIILIRLLFGYDKRNLFSDTDFLTFWENEGCLIDIF